MMTTIAVEWFDTEWFDTEWSSMWSIPATAVLMLATVILVVRVIGLRSFSKMSSFDFAVTVSIGSILGGVTSTSTPVLNGVIAVASLLGLQWLVSQFRSRSALEQVVDNTPLLLMDGAEMLEDNLKTARVTSSDIVAKLREANVLTFDDVQAVVLETTGDISVLHGDRPVEPQLLDGVRGRPGSDSADAERQR